MGNYFFIKRLKIKRKTEKLRRFKNMTKSNIEILKEKKEFDYTKKEDWEWMYTSAGCADWLEKVIQQNIDSEFVKPECMLRRKYGAIL